MRFIRKLIPNLLYEFANFGEQLAEIANLLQVRLRSLNCSHVIPFLINWDLIFYSWKSIEFSYLLWTNWCFVNFVIKLIEFNQDSFLHKQTIWIAWQVYSFWYFQKNRSTQNMWQLPFAELPQCRCQLFKPKKTQVSRISFALRSSTLTHLDGQRYSFASTYSQISNEFHQHTRSRCPCTRRQAFDILYVSVWVDGCGWNSICIFYWNVSRKMCTYTWKMRMKATPRIVSETRTHIARESIVYLQTWCESYIIFYIYVWKTESTVHMLLVCIAYTRTESTPSTAATSTTEQRIVELMMCISLPNTLYCVRDRERCCRDIEARSSPSALHAHNAIR